MDWSNPAALAVIGGAALVFMWCILLLVLAYNNYWSKIDE